MNRDPDNLTRRMIPMIMVFIVLGLGQNFAWTQEEESPIDDTTQTIRDVGDVVQVALPVTALAATLFSKDKEGAFQLLKSFGFGVASVSILKYGAGKLRPDASAPNSFPSGHTFAAFSGASFINRRYGVKYGIPAFAAATFVGYSRVRGQKHYLDDVIAGGAIAILWNLRFVTPRTKNIAVEPLLLPDGYGVALSASW